MRHIFVLMCVLLFRNAVLYCIKFLRKTLLKYQTLLCILYSALLMRKNRNMRNVYYKNVPTLRLYFNTLKNVQTFMNFALQIGRHKNSIFSKIGISRVLISPHTFFLNLFAISRRYSRNLFYLPEGRNAEK